MFSINRNYPDAAVTARHLGGSSSHKSGKSSDGRLVYLDGIRGVAAILICIRHTENLWNVSFFRGYLAVDLFFILSGFVIAMRYDRELQSQALGRIKFFALRIARLYPSFFLATLVCALTQAFLFFHGGNIGAESGPRLAAMVGCMFLMIPFPPAVGTALLFPLDSVCWSLFYEVICNFIYGATQRWLGTRRLIAVIATSMVVVSIVAFRAGNLDTGFTFAPVSICGGLFRSIFGIFTGLLLYRFRPWLAQRFSLGHPLLWFAVVTAVLCAPNLGNWNPVFDLLASFVIFPLAILRMGTPSKTKLAWTFEALGAASYPLYVFHLPLSEIVRHATHGSLIHHAPYSGIAFLVVAVVGAKAIADYWEPPMRRGLMAWFQWINARFKRDAGSVPRTAT